MTIRYLWLLKENQKNRLIINDDRRPETIGLENFPVRYRISPIFPVLPGESVLPNLNEDTYIGFFFYEQASYTIGRLLNTLPQNDQKSLWFSHGLASIIAFSTNLSLIDRISTDFNENLKAFEYWFVSNEVIERNEIKIYAIDQINNQDYLLTDYSSLNEDQQHIISELEHCLLASVERASRFQSSLLPLFKQLTKTVNVIIEELKFLENTKIAPPPTLPTSVSSQVHSHPDIRQKMTNQRVGILVQINSHLSYVINQAFSGRPPIIENECIIRSYSLLGIGSAFLGVCEFTKHIESVFERFPVDNVISDRYNTAAGIPIFPRLGNFNPTYWSRHNVNIDTCLDGTSTDPINKKLVAFSGRQGFRESESAVTVALPVLEFADSARWSLMTLTHEMLHGHVRGLLASLFSDSEHQSLNAVFPKYYEFFKDACTKNCSEKYFLKQCLIFILLNYSIYKANIDKTGHRDNIEIPDENTLQIYLTDSFRDINEIIVHVLDYNYFYNRNDNLYVSLLWTSWTPVPSVLEDVESYLLRTIVTVATKETGNILDRFDLSCNKVERIIEKCFDMRPNSIVMKEALQLLNNATSLKKLSIQFLPEIYLAEMASNFLLSKNIYSELLNDENLYIDSELLKYRIEFPQFDGILVESPTAFVSDRLCRRLRNEEDSSFTSSYLACWLLLNCASVKRTGGKL